MDQDKTERVVMLLQLMRREEGRNALRLLSHSLMDHLFSSSQPATHVHVVRACLRACVRARGPIGVCQGPDRGPAALGRVRTVLASANLGSLHHDGREPWQLHDLVSPDVLVG